MNKKLFIILILCVGIFAVAVAYELRPQTQPLVILSTSPADQTSQNPFSPLAITFNRTPKENEVAISIVPSTKTTSSVEGNTIKITPDTMFLPNTQYAVSVNTSPPYSFGFTTQSDIGNSPSSHVITVAANEQYRQQNATQDAELSFIRLHAPLKEAGFTINYSYADDVYTIGLSQPYDQNKTSFLEWLTQSGVTNLTNLRVVYVEQ
jgi:hypothetical protein